MKAWLTRLFTIIVLTVVSAVGSIAFVPSKSLGFGLTEEEQWEVDIDEAKKRAKDFKRFQVDLRKRSRERESASDEIKRIREQEEAEREASRREYLKTRNKRLVEERERERLEKLWEKQSLLEEKREDETRANYVTRRRRVQELLKRQAHIDGNEEYDLRWQETKKPAKGLQPKGP